MTALVKNFWLEKLYEAESAITAHGMVQVITWVLKLESDTIWSITAHGMVQVITWVLKLESDTIWSISGSAYMELYSSHVEHREALLYVHDIFEGEIEITQLAATHKDINFLPSNVAFKKVEWSELPLYMALEYKTPEFVSLLKRENFKKSYRMRIELLES